MANAPPASRPVPSQNPAGVSMTTSMSPDLIEDHGMTAEPELQGGEKRVAGRSPTQIALGRLRRDPIAMICFGVVVFFSLVAVFAGAPVQPARGLHRHRPGQQPGRPGHRAPAHRPAQPRLRHATTRSGWLRRRATTTSPTGSTAAGPHCGWAHGDGALHHDRGDPRAGRRFRRRHRSTRSSPSSPTCSSRSRSCWPRSRSRRSSPTGSAPTSTSTTSSPSGRSW